MPDAQRWQLWHPRSRPNRSVRSWTWTPPATRWSGAMTFNEGMQIDTRTTWSSGGGGRVMAIGGGLGGLVIVVVALLLGVDPGTVMPAPQPGQAQQAQGFDVSQCKTGADANKILGGRII